MKIADITTVVRAKLISDVYKKWVKPKSSVLDIGCGTGIVADELRKSLDIRVEGCDINSYLIRPIKFKVMNSVEKLDYRNNLFECSMLNDVLHHTDYDIQEKLLKEALRVSKTVLIFELLPTLSGKIADFIINKIHNPKMNIPYTYRTHNQWKKLFKKQGYLCKTHEVRKPFWYPFSHIAFLVTHCR